MTIIVVTGAPTMTAAIPTGNRMAADTKKDAAMIDVTSTGDAMTITALIVWYRVATLVLMAAPASDRAPSACPIPAPVSSLALTTTSARRCDPGLAATRVSRAPGRSGSRLYKNVAPSKGPMPTTVHRAQAAPAAEPRGTGDRGAAQSR